MVGFHLVPTVWRDQSLEQPGSGEIIVWRDSCKQTSILHCILKDDNYLYRQLEILNHILTCLMIESLKSSVVTLTMSSPALVCRKCFLKLILCNQINIYILLPYHCFMPTTHFSYNIVHWLKHSDLTWLLMHIWLLDNGCFVRRASL